MAPLRTPLVARHPVIAVMACFGYGYTFGTLIANRALDGATSRLSGVVLLVTFVIGLKASISLADHLVTCWSRRRKRR